MIKRIQMTIVLLLSLLTPFSLSQAMATEAKRQNILVIEAFIMSDRPLIHIDAASHCCTVTIFQLDGLAELTAELSVGLPNNPALAEQIVKKAFAERRDELRAAAQGHTKILEKAIGYGLEKYPALVFNEGESVIYGVIDMAEALRIYQRAGRR